jgi:uncharacterized paraquat-inducible protein A
MKKLIILLVVLSGSYSSFAQKAKANSDTGKTGTVITTEYICPMHPDVTSDKPGKCSKCGMDLNLSKKEQLKREIVKLYTCPMHTDVTSDKPGKCSKCGMDLNLSKKEQLKREVVKLYTCPMDLKETVKTTTSYSCPMHPDVTSDKPGKCSKCNMDLKEKKEDHSNHQH